MIKILYSDALEVLTKEELAPYTFPAKPKDVLKWDVPDEHKFYLLAKSGVWPIEQIIHRLSDDKKHNLLYHCPSLELERTLQP